MKSVSAISEYNGAKLALHHHVKSIVLQITEVKEMKHDMCVNTCIGFTGSFALLDYCLECSEPHYKKQLVMMRIKVPHHQFVSYPTFWTYLWQCSHTSSRPPDPCISVHRTSIPSQLVCIICPLSHCPKVISHISTILVWTSDPRSDLI